MKGIICTVFASIFLLSVHQRLESQVLISDLAPVPADPNAMVKLSGDSGGFLYPRLTEFQRLSINSPAVGLTVYQYNERVGYYVFVSPGWVYHARIRKEHGTIKVDVSSASPSIIATNGTGFTVTQLTGPQTNVFDVVFDNSFDNTPNITVSSEPFPTTEITIGDYCASTHGAFCDNFFNADYMDDVIIESFQNGSQNMASSMYDLASNCNLQVDNYVDNTAVPGLQPIIYGQCGPGGAGNTYNMAQRSSFEWGDDMYAYIDWNQDADFYDANETIMNQAAPTPNDLLVELTGLVVPVDAANGITFMRCISQFTIYDEDSCGDTFFGETQDYQIEVVGACGNPSPDDRASVCSINQVSANGFRVYCTDVNAVPKAASFSFYATE